MSETQGRHQDNQSAENQNPPQHTGLKIVVAVLTGLIVIALGLLVYGMARTAANLGKPEEAAQSEAAAASVAPAPFGTIESILPPGAEWQHTALNGAQLAITLRLPQGQLSVLVFDLNSGQQLGRIELKP